MEREFPIIEIVPDKTEIVPDKTEIVPDKTEIVPDKTEEETSEKIKMTGNVHEVIIFTFLSMATKRLLVYIYSY